MAGITITKLDPDATAPLHEKFTGRNTPQPAYLEMDEDGNVGFVVSGDIGGRPAEVHMGRTLRWSVPGTLSATDANELAESLRPALERVHAGHAVAFDGRNMRGTLDADAKAADGLVEEACARAVGTVDVWDATEWMMPNGAKAAFEDMGLTHASTDDEIEEVARLMVEAARRDGVVLDGDVARALREARDEMARDHEDEPDAPAFA